jgi:diadenosine tetraphosphate (Ap4A) HIT family hydrolase
MAGCDCFENRLVLRRYEHWWLRLSPQQGFLGWSLIVLNRHAEDGAELTAAEATELWDIAREARGALVRLFAPDHFNYAILGNTVRHVHLHLMPRYQSPREFAGLTFRDEHWGWFAIPGIEEAPSEMLEALQSAMRAELESEGGA